jgi:hypothetical protein
VWRPSRPLWRPFSTEIYLCNVCSCQGMLRRSGRAQARARCESARERTRRLLRQDGEGAQLGAEAAAALRRAEEAWAAHQFDRAAELYGTVSASMPEQAAAHGESFLHVHWVAVPEAMRARRINRRRWRRWRGRGRGVLSCLCLARALCLPWTSGLCLHGPWRCAFEDHGMRGASTRVWLVLSRCVRCAGSQAGVEQLLEDGESVVGGPWGTPASRRVEGSWPPVHVWISPAPRQCVWTRTNVT